MSSTSIAPTLPTITLPTFPSAGSIVNAERQYILNRPALQTNFQTGSLSETFIEAVAIALGSDATTWPGVTQQGAYQYLAEVQGNAYILTASGSFLDAKAADVGVFRKPAIAATGPVVLATNAPVSGAALAIPVGTVVSGNSADPNAGPILFETTQPGSIATGQASSGNIPAQALIAGKNGNLPGGTITNLSSNIPGVTGVSNPLPMSGGDDTEGDLSLRIRALAAIPNASQCTISAIEMAALAYPGLTTAKLYENVDANLNPLDGTCQLFLDDGSGNLSASTNTTFPSVIALQNDLNSGLYRAAGITVHCSPATAVYMSIALSVYASPAFIAGGGTNASLATAIQNALFLAVNSQPVGTRLNLDFIARTTWSVNGVSELVLSSITINGSNADYIPTPQQSTRLLALSNITVTVLGTE